MLLGGEANLPYPYSGKTFDSNSMIFSKDLEDSDTMNRVMITFQIGRQLILELSRLMEKRKNRVTHKAKKSSEILAVVRMPKSRGKQLHETSLGIPDMKPKRNRQKTKAKVWNICYPKISKALK